MTIRIPPDNLIDKILKQFGVKRVLVLPENIDSQKNKYGHHIQIKAKHESLLKTILRQFKKENRDFTL